MGDLGMSLDDFRRLRMEEIDAVLTTRGRIRTEEARRDWEVMRLQTYITISPFCKNLGSPKKLLPFPWDDEEAEQEETASLSLEERRENARRTRAALGW